MKKLRIAIWHNLPSGGGKRALFDQIKGLTECGHYVESWCPPSANQKFLPIHSVVIENIVPLSEVPSLRFSNPVTRRIALVLGTARKMKLIEEHCNACWKEISAKNFDVLLVHPCQFFRVSPIGKYSKIPTICYLQEPFRELYEAWPELPWIAPSKTFRPLSLGYWNTQAYELLDLYSKRIQAREELSWIKSYGQILVNSLFSRESLLRTYNLNSRVCYLGVDTQSFFNTSNFKSNYVVGLGNIYHNKRLLTAVEAIGNIPISTRPKLVWIGNFAEPVYLDQVRNLAKQLDVDFEFKILIPDDELRQVLSEAAVMIYTSHLEPFGYAPLEANACGTGVVAIAEGGVKETVGNPKSGFLVNGLDPEELGHAISKFTSDLDYAQNFGKEARRYAKEHWSQDQAMDRLERELHRLMENSSQTASLNSKCSLR